MRFEIKSALSAPETSAWDRFVSASPNAHFYQRSAWAEFERRESGRAVLYISGFNGDELRCVAAVHRRRIPLLGGGVDEIACGPVFNEPEDLADFLSFIEEGLGKQAASLTLSPRWDVSHAQKVEQVLRDRGYSVLPDPNHGFYHYETVRVDLKPDTKDIFSSFRQTTQHEITKADKVGLTFLTNNTPEAFARFSVLYHKHTQKKGLKILSKEFFQNVQRGVLSSVDNGWLALCLKGDELLSGGVFFRNGPVLWYTYGASDPELKTKYSTSHWFHWKNILHAREMGCATYDFGGARKDVQPDDSRYGVAIFKTGFSKNFVTFLPPCQKVFRKFPWSLIQTKRKLSRLWR